MLQSSPTLVVLVLTNHIAQISDVSQNLDLSIFENSGPLFLETVKRINAKFYGKLPAHISPTFYFSKFQFVLMHFLTICFHFRLNGTI